TEVHLGYFATSWRDFRGRAHPLYLRTSPELHMKRTLSQDLPRVFQLGACFRNDGEVSRWHQPEFTMLEWYAADVTVEEFVAETEARLRETATALASDFGLTLPFDPAASLRHLTVAQAFQEHAGIALVDGDPELAAKASAAGIGS